MQGKGTMVYSNNDKYIGNWFDGVRHGKGEYHSYIDGKIKKGKWDNDTFLETRIRFNHPWLALLAAPGVGNYKVHSIV